MNEICRVKKEKITLSVEDISFETLEDLVNDIDDEQKEKLQEYEIIAQNMSFVLLTGILRDTDLDSENYHAQIRKLQQKLFQKLKQYFDLDSSQPKQLYYLESLVTVDYIKLLLDNILTYCIKDNSTLPFLAENIYKAKLNHADNAYTKIEKNNPHYAKIKNCNKYYHVTDIYVKNNEDKQDFLFIFSNNVAIEIENLQDIPYCIEDIFVKYYYRYNYMYYLYEMMDNVIQDKIEYIQYCCRKYAK